MEAADVEEEIMENRKDIYNLWIQYTTKVIAFA